MCFIFVCDIEQGRLRSIQIDFYELIQFERVRNKLGNIEYDVKFSQQSTSCIETFLMKIVEDTSIVS